MTTENESDQWSDASLVKRANSATGYREITDCLRIFLGKYPNETLDQIANRLSQPVSWIIKSFKWDKKIEPQVLTLAREGKLAASKLWSFAKLTYAEQLEYVETAISLTPIEFYKVIETYKKSKRIKKSD